MADQCSTSYVNVFNPLPNPVIINNKRDESAVNQSFEKRADIQSLLALGQALVTKACECFLGPVQTPTTSTVTVTAYTTVVVPSTSVTVVPAATTIITQTVTNTQTQDVTITTLSFTTLTNTISSTVTVSSASVSTRIVTLTTVTVITSTYNKALEDLANPAAVYNEYTDYLEVPSGLTGYAANDYCGSQCAALGCLTYDYYRSDPAYRNQGDNSAWCIIDNQVYNSGLTQRVPFAKYAVIYSLANRASSTSVRTS